MTLNKLASEISKLEGKKKQVSIGNIREVLRCLEVVIATEMAEGNPGDNLGTLSGIASRSHKRSIAIKKKLNRPF